MGQWLMMWVCLFHQTCGKDQVDGIMVDDVDVSVIMCVLNTVDDMV